MKSISNILVGIKGNLSTKCESCKASVKNKDAYVETIKRLEWVHPKETNFCSEECCKNYIIREKNTPKRRSTCSMCPTPPDG